MKTFTITIHGETSNGAEVLAEITPLLSELVHTLNNRGFHVLDRGLHFGTTPDEGKKFVPAHVGGGYYELSNGERVKGKAAAVAAQAAL